ncbi:hypothetical protein ACLIA0_12350 [Bacillaceae bacterium W0354]
MEKVKMVERKIFYNVQIGSNDIIWNYTWNPVWINSFESGWSIFEKFRLYNCITNQELIYLLRKKLTQSPNSQTGVKYRNLYTLKGLNEVIINNIIGKDFCESNNQNIKVISKGCYVNLKLFRQHLSYCPICISHGYHSLFHQYIFVHKCPFHNIKLHDKCPKCKYQLPFTINNDKRLPFGCICGFKFMKADIVDYKKVYNLNNIKDNSLGYWLTINNFNYDKFIFSRIIRRKKPGEHFNLNITDLLRIHKKEFRNSNFVVYKGHKNINSIRSQTQFREMVCSKLGILYFKKYDFFTERLKSIDDELMETAKYIHSSIGRNIRRKILIKHKQCIFQITRSTDSLLFYEHCPYAFVTVK